MVFFNIFTSHPQPLSPNGERGFFRIFLNKIKFLSPNGERGFFRIFLVYFFGLFFLFSCSQKNENADIPKNILSPQKMRNILIDIHLEESQIVQSVYHFPDTARKVYSEKSQLIWKKHKVDSLTFRKSYDFYAKYPKLFHQIYSEVVDSLSLKESKQKAKIKK